MFILFQMDKYHVLFTNLESRNGVKAKLYTLLKVGKCGRLGIWHGSCGLNMRGLSKKRDVRAERAAKEQEDFSQITVKGLGCSVVQVVRYLGVTDFCVMRIVAERQLSEEVRLRYQAG